MSAAARALLLATLVAATGCEREQRRFESPGAPPSEKAEIEAPLDSMPADYEETAYAISQGRLLYRWYNCSGCHAHGGGNIGPPLMDDAWRYGHQPDQIYASIMEGRPEGMPAFGGRLASQQALQLVAYVRSMGILTDRDAAPGRDDGIQKGKPVQRRSPAHPVTAGGPGG
jgi:cytochrome c oxidase cbb3-type subunit III